MDNDSRADELSMMRCAVSSPRNEKLEQLLRRKTIYSLFRDWQQLPGGLHLVLLQAGYPKGVNGIWAKGSEAGRAVARWVDDWQRVDVAGPLSRPMIRTCRIIEVEGPNGTVRCRIFK